MSHDICFYIACCFVGLACLGLILSVMYIFYDLYRRYLPKNEAILIGIATGLTFFLLPIHMGLYEKFRGR